MNFGVPGMKREMDLGSKPDRKAIASAIQRYLDANGLARKDLIREQLSKSSIEKLFQGDFTERTLNKVEGVLKTSFQWPSSAKESVQIRRRICLRCRRISARRLSLHPPDVRKSRQHQCLPDHDRLER